MVLNSLGGLWRQQFSQSLTGECAWGTPQEGTRFATPMVFSLDMW